MQRDLIEDSELLQFRVVQLQEGNVFRVGAPPEGVPVAVIDLLEVNPVGLAVADDVRSVPCQRLLSLHGDIDDMEVVAADKGDLLAVRAESRQLLLARLARQLDRLLSIE